MRGEQLRFFSSDNDANSRNRRRLIVVPLDTFILSSVVIILLFILAFSLGVERGRKIYYSSLVEDKENLVEKSAPDEDPIIKTQAKASAPAVTIKKEVSKTSQVASVTSQPVRVDAKPESVTKAVAVNSEVGPRYCIQIASYSKDSFAQAEAKQLQAKGIPVFLLRKGDFAVLYAGVFETRPDAEKTLGLLKKTYKDCSLRRLQ